MQDSERLVRELANVRRYFEATLGAFGPEDAGFTPHADAFTVAGQVAHVADTVDWFVNAAFGEGWDTDWLASNARAKAVTDLDDAKAWLDRAFRACAEAVGGASDEALAALIPDQSFMQGATRRSIVAGITDHTAHHRGSLAVYARLLGKTPPVPYQ
ncbi:MAG: DinB family protein [Gemmatimonadota bacterium]